MSYNNKGYVLRVKHSQLQPSITGKLYQTTLHVDNSLKTGIQLGAFVDINHNGQSAEDMGRIIKTPTMVPAAGFTTTKMPAGFIYEASRRDQYGRTDNFATEERRYPFGPREDVALSLVEEGVINISVEDNPNAPRIWYTTKTAGVKIADLNVGQWFEDGAGDFYVLTKKEGTKVVHVDGAGLQIGAEVSANPNDTVTVKGMLDKDIYLAPNSDNEPLPFIPRTERANGSRAQRGRRETLPPTRQPRTHQSQV